MKDAGATVKRLNQLTGQGMAVHLAMAVANGSMDESRAWDAQRLRDRADSLRSMQPGRWPTPDVTWDVDPGRFNLSLDGVSAERFAQLFPTIQVVGVDTGDLDLNMMRVSTRDASPFAKAFRAKTAGLVAHLEAGGALTPPLVRSLPEGICLAGGHHRYGWARHRDHARIPILVSDSELATLRSALSTLGSWP